MSYSVQKLPSNKFKVQFRSRHINGSISKTFPSKAEATRLGEKLNQSLNNLLDGEKATCNGLIIQDTKLDIIIKTNEVNNEFKTNFYNRI